MNDRYSFQEWDNDDIINLLKEEITGIMEDIEGYVGNLELWESCNGGTLEGLKNRIAYDLDDGWKNGYVDCTFIYSTDSPKPQIEDICGIHINNWQLGIEFDHSFDEETRNRLISACKERDSLYKEEAQRTEQDLIVETDVMRIYRGSLSDANFYFSKDRQELVPVTIAYDPEKQQIAIGCAFAKEDFEHRGFVKQYVSQLWNTDSEYKHLIVSPSNQAMTQRDFSIATQYADTMIKFFDTMLNAPEAIKNLPAETIAGTYPINAFENFLKEHLQQDTLVVVPHYDFFHEVNEEIGENMTQLDYCNAIGGVQVEITTGTDFTRTLYYGPDFIELSKIAEACERRENYFQEHEAQNFETTTDIDEEDIDDR